MGTYTLSIDGDLRTVECDDDTPLLYVLRDELGLDNPKFGCGLAQCGACSVLLGQMPVRSCSIPISAITDQITTIKGIGTPNNPHPIQQAFIDEQAMFCGYCMNGWVIEAVSFLAQNKNPSEDQIRRRFANLKCRCGSHSAIIKAIIRASEMI